MEIEIKKGNIESCLQIRKTVFVDEQNVPIELEIDEMDDKKAECDHFLISVDGKNVGTFRCYYEMEDVIHVQRFCVLKEYRHCGLGSKAIAFVENNYKGIKMITVGAQCSAKEFYKKNGFVVVSDIYMDAGIEHVSMEKYLK